MVESFSPGYMDGLGLGYLQLDNINPMIIMTSITPFGQKGPYRDFKGPTVVVLALSGILYTIGDPDRPPIAPSYDHAHLVGAANAAVGTLTALFHRSVIGHGEYVDCPTMLELAFFGLGEVQSAWELQRRILRRMGRKRMALNLKGGKVIFQTILWECKDGDIAFTLGFGQARVRSNYELVKWMKIEGHSPGPLGRWDFETMDWS